MAKLKPCPFCGVVPEVHYYINGDKKYYYIACGNQFCRINPSTDYHVTKAVVVREWNRRTSDERI